MLAFPYGSKGPEIRCPRRLDELLAQPAPIGCAGIAAGARKRREGDGLINLAAGNLHLHGRVKKVG